MKLRVALIGVLASAAVRSCGEPPPVVRANADAFRASIGVNIHLGYDATPYSDPAAVLAALHFLGVTHVRDSALREAGNTLPRYVALAKGGAEFDLFVNRNIDDQLGRVDRLLAAAPGALQSLEGPNEANHEPFDTSYGRGAQAAQRYQAELYRRARAWPRLARLPIFNLTYWPPLFGRADAANFHAYPEADQSIARVLGWQRRLTSAVQPRGSAVVCTETGYPTAGRAAVSERRQGELETILLLENFRAGVSQTFLYELFDERAGAPSAASDREDHWGLFRYDRSPKPGAFAVRRLMQILASPSEAPAAARTTPIILRGVGFRTLNLTRSDGGEVTLAWTLTPKTNASSDVSAWVGPRSRVQVMTLATGNVRQLDAGDNLVVLTSSPMAFIQTPADVRSPNGATPRSRRLVDNLE